MDDLCDMFGDLGKSDPTISCYDMLADLPSLKKQCSARRQPGRECKSRLKPNTELLKRAMSKLSSKDVKTSRVETSKGTKWHKLLESPTSPSVSDLQKMLSNEIQYVKVLLTIFDILESNPELKTEKELYTELYNAILGKQVIIKLLDNISNGSVDTNSTNELKDQSKFTIQRGEKEDIEYKQSVFRKNLYITIDGKTYERNDFWPIIAKLKKILASQSRQLDATMEMDGGSSNTIMRLYKKYCK